MKFAYNLNYNYSNIIMDIASALDCNSYLELGLNAGYTFNKVSSVVYKCVGVDIYKKFEPNVNSRLFIGTTDDFFKSNKECFDIIFIDADHNFAQVKKDFENSIKILNEFGVIFLHDTDPVDRQHISSEYCGDSYKAPDWLYESHSELNIFTLPITEAGLTIVNRKTDRRVNKFL